jgi:hypothetical protein
MNVGRRAWPSCSLLRGTAQNISCSRWPRRACHACVRDSVCHAFTSCEYFSCLVFGNSLVAPQGQPAQRAEACARCQREARHSVGRSSSRSSGSSSRNRPWQDPYSHAAELARSSPRRADDTGGHVWSGKLKTFCLQASCRGDPPQRFPATPLPLSPRWHPRRGGVTWTL